MIAFDTLKYSKGLIDVGVSQKQAERQAELLAEVIDSQLATKHDLKTLEFRIIKRMGSLIVTCTAILGVLISLLGVLIAVHH